MERDGAKSIPNSVWRLLMGRQLATIRRVSSIEPIENADNIELLHIDGWQVVSKKGAFKEGDLCVYFEIDSILPKTATWSSFMEGRKFKVKTIKLRGTLSQGLALPLYDLPMSGKVVEGRDVTELLGVTKYDPQEEYERRCFSSKKIPWYYNYPFGPTLYRLLNPKVKRNWPQYLKKTDETRVQNIEDIKVYTKYLPLYATEKLDGMSTTIFYNRDAKTSFFKKGIFGVCSRNLLVSRGTPWYDIAEKHNLQNTLKDYCESWSSSLAIQGELVGPSIQGNKYNLKENELYVFSIYDIERKAYLSRPERAFICEMLNLKMVPDVPYKQLPNEQLTAENLLVFAEGKSALNPAVEREGVVMRAKKDDGISFKAISNKWLLKYDKV